MVHLKCYLSCSIRRCAPEEDSQNYAQYLLSVMGELSREAQFKIEAIEEDASFRYAHQKPYEDKIVGSTFNLYFTKSTYIRAKEKLLRAFRSLSEKRNNIDCWLHVPKDPLIKDDHLSFTHEMNIDSFALGCLTSPSDLHLEFYHGNLMVTKHPKFSMNAHCSEYLTIEFAVSQGLRFTRVERGATSATTEVYSLEIKVQDIDQVLVHKVDDDVDDVCFLLNTPMNLYRTQQDFTNPDKVNSITNWVKTCSFKSQLDNVNDEGIQEDILGWSDVLMVRFFNTNDVQNLLDSWSWYNEKNVQYALLNYHASVLENITDIPQVSMANNSGDMINWLLMAVDSTALHVSHQWSERHAVTFMKLVKKYSKGQTLEHLKRALSRTIDVLAAGDLGCRFLHIDRVLDYFLKQKENLEEYVPKGSHLVKRLILTPTKKVFLSPTPIHDNRIIHDYDRDSMVSCLMQNDDKSGFGMANTDFVNEGIGDVLRAGVPVAGRHYEFLGCSGSQLGQNSCWLYASDHQGKTAENIRSEVGDLEKIRNPALYLSRFGQCLSDTTCVELDEDVHITWHDKDIKGGCDPDGQQYTFTDGIGRISQEALDEIFTKLPEVVSWKPSAFQLRMGGSKGMVALDPRLKGKQIRLRESMFKFKSSHSKVEVMRRSRPVPLLLNRQVITILCQLKNGIPNDTFVKLLNNMLHNLADILLDEEKALEVLAQSGFPCCYGKLHKQGFKFTTDPFCKGVLKAIICARIRDLKQKARIVIPPDYGRSMLGVVDEEGVLEYGQVFIKYSASVKEPGVDPIVLKGPVVVAKMPSLHPGDIRQLTAVDHPKLHHLVDCIVFPSKGPRPHPNEMAGSDLDGDEYFVTWLPDLIFKGQNFQPMSFPKREKPQQDHPITENDLIDFLVKFIINSDKKGRLSNGHLAMADQCGVHSEVCIELAKLFSHVIDFNKTGYLPAQVEGREINQLLPDTYPDFMNKQDHKSTYESGHVLGDLYRVTNRVEHSVSTLDRQDNDRLKDRTKWTIDERLKLSEHTIYMKEARNLYAIYATQVNEFRKHYGIGTDEELFSGALYRINGPHSRSDDAVRSINQRLQAAIPGILKCMRKEFDRIVKLLVTDTLPKSKIERSLASACYVVAYSDKEQHLSFPWVFAEHLVEILKRRKTKAGPKSSMELLNESIESIEITDIYRELTSKGLSAGKASNNYLRALYLLIKWGMKTAFVSEGKDVSQGSLSLLQFVKITNKCYISAHKELRGREITPALLLIELCKQLSSFNDDTVIDETIKEKALVNMKRNIILGHHQLARDPRAECLDIRQETVITRRIHVQKHRWKKYDEVRQTLMTIYQQRYSVKVEFVDGKKKKADTGSLLVTGKEQAIIAFEELFIADKLPTTTVPDLFDGLLVRQNKNNKPTRGRRGQSMPRKTDKMLEPEVTSETWGEW